MGSGWEDSVCGVAWRKCAVQPEGHRHLDQIKYDTAANFYALNMQNSSEQEILKRLGRIERKLDSIIKAKRSTVWVGAADIMKVTGWNKDEMYRMRKAGAIEYKKMGKSIVYNPASVPEVFVKGA